MYSFGQQKKLLGEGVTGKVYTTTKGYAVKEASTDQGMIEVDMLKEITSLVRIAKDNPINVIQIVDVILNPDQTLIILPLAQTTLFDYMLDNPTYDIKLIYDQIVNGVYELHRANIWHLDLKPNNILVNIRQGQPQILITDLGNSVVNRCSAFKVDRDYVTLPYRAPELIGSTRTVSEKVDVWSLGVILAELYLNSNNSTGQYQSLFAELADYSEEETINNIRAYVDNPDKYFNRFKLTNDQKDALKAILIPSRLRRPTVNNLQQSTCLDRLKNNIIPVQYNGWKSLKQRATVLDWYSNLVTQYHLSLTTQSLAIWLIDTTMAILRLAHTKIQLYASACLILASMIYEENYLVSADLIFVSNDIFTKDQLVLAVNDVLTITGVDLAVTTVWPVVVEIARLRKIDRIIALAEAWRTETKLMTYFDDPVEVANRIVNSIVK